MTNERRLVEFVLAIRILLLAKRVSRRAGSGSMSLLGPANVTIGSIRRWFASTIDTVLQI